MKKYFSFIIGLFLVILTSLHCFAAGQVEKDPALSGKVENGIRIIEVKASRYKFEPDPIVVKLGEKVRLVVTSIDVAHGIAISEFKVNLPVPAGKTESVEFVAEKKGKFRIYCSVYCGPGHSQMRGTLIVQK